MPTPRHVVCQLLLGGALAVGIGGCAGLHKAEPLRELEILAVSSNKNPQLAADAAKARVQSRATWVRAQNAVRFVLDRSKSKPTLKLIGEATGGGLGAEVTSRKPYGSRATVRLLRSDEELSALAALEVASVRAEASGLDLAVAQERADRAVFREAVLSFASARGLKEPLLYGTLSIVNYSANDSGDRVVVSADINVVFGAREVILQPKAKGTEAYVSETLEEVEPPEESSTP